MTPFEMRKTPEWVALWDRIDDYARAWKHGANTSVARQRAVVGVEQALDSVVRVCGAPLHLAAPGEVERLRARVAELEAREAEACPLCYGSSRYVSDVDCDRCGNTGAVLVTP